MTYALIAFLSTRPVQAPCPPQDHIGCRGHDARGLAPGGILVHWFALGSPAISLTDEAGRPTTIGGHRARVSTGRAVGLCRAVHADRMIQAWITQDPTVGGPQLIGMTACLTRPAQSVAVAAMLRSVRLPD